MGPDALIGIWRLVSWHVIVDGQPQDLFGAHPQGFLILTAEGRAMVLTTAEHRRAGESTAERAALHTSMLAYTGRYRVEGSAFITTVDVSWNERWNGTEQRRRFRIEGDRLFIESAPAPSLIYPGLIDHRRMSGSEQECDQLTAPCYARRPNTNAGMPWGFETLCRLPL